MLRLFSHLEGLFIIWQQQQHLCISKPSCRTKCLDGLDEVAGSEVKVWR